MSVGRNVRGAKCPWGEMSVGRNVRGARCRGARCRGASCPGASCPGASYLGASGPGTVKYKKNQLCSLSVDGIISIF
jgi:hypothetical protein